MEVNEFTLPSSFDDSLFLFVQATKALCLDSSLLIYGHDSGDVDATALVHMLLNGRSLKFCGRIMLYSLLLIRHPPSCSEIL